MEYKFKARFAVTGSNHEGGGGGGVNCYMAGMQGLVLSHRGVNYRFWSHFLGCGQPMILFFSHQDFILGFT